MKLKVGLVTIVDYGNFGNRLQNYAICNILRDKYDCEIDTLVSCSKRTFVNECIHIIKAFIVKLSFFVPTIGKPSFGVRTACYREFHKWSEFIPIKEFYQSDGLPASLNNQYDLFLCGSDQIWNYHHTADKLNDFFLTFADEEKRFSLCASFGLEKISEKWQPVYKEGLRGFKEISVRENAGAIICNQLIGKDVPVLIDPVMMLNAQEWKKVQKKVNIDVNQKYILKLYLGENQETKKVEKWAKQNGYQIYELMNLQIQSCFI